MSKIRFLFSLSIDGIEVVFLLSYIFTISGMLSVEDTTGTELIVLPTLVYHHLQYI